MPTPVFARLSGCVSVVAIVVSLVGCQVYQPLELDHETVEEALLPLGDKPLAVATGEIRHPLLRPLPINADDGLSPAEAAVIAVVANPALRAARDRRNEARAQLLQAGILPNPTLGGSLDFVTGGATAGTRTATGFGVGWDLRALLTRPERVKAARENATSIQLDVAWLEWQTALAAESAVYDVAALEAQVAQAEEIDDRLAKNADLMEKAAAAHEKTIIDSTAATATANDARSILLGLRQELEQRRIALNRALGFPANRRLRIQSDTAMPSRVDPPSETELLAGLEERRLDLLALKRGYESEDALLRAAIIAQFPNINIGLNRATDTGNVQTLGPAVSVDLPLFDRNQGNIAIERATRQRLKDAYTNRVFEARSDIASALANIHSLNEQIAQAEAALPTLRHLVNVSNEAVSKGSSSLLGLYTAQNDLTRKSIDIIRLKQQLAQFRVALQTAAAWHLAQ